MSGLILPAGSPLVQFEVQRPSRVALMQKPPGVEFPFLVWVNRAPQPRDPRRYPCDCGSHVWSVDRKTLPRKGEMNRAHPSVCLCMGRFIE